MAAIQKAERIIASNTRSDTLDLQGVGLDDLSPLLGSLSRMQHLKRLNLANNRLTGLPEDLSSIRGVESLNISSNPIAGLSSILRGLYCLPRLQDLSVDLQEDEEDEVVSTIPTLVTINGITLPDDEDGEPSPARGHSQAGSVSSPSNSRPLIGAKSRWDEGDMSQVQKLYKAANGVSGRVASQGEFDKYTKDVIRHLNNLLHGEEDPLKREAEILGAKKILYEYCFEEIARSSQRYDSNLTQALVTLQDTYGALLANYERLTKNIFEEKARRVEAMQQEMQKPIQEIESLMAQLEAKGNGDASRAQFDADRRKYVEEIGWLRAENEKLQTKLRQSELSFNGDASKGLQNRSGGPTSPNVTQSSAPAIGSKVLTQRQLRDTIEEIYVSKSKYDIKCAETHLPRETMEQHMYTHLNQKYGLKHIILEWATAIIQGIKKYSPEDNDVAVFGKILRNEVDEEFRFVQRQLKETVHELLRVYVKGKLPLKSDEEINGIVKKKTSGNLLEEEWIDIVKYMYNSEDAVTIIMRIHSALKQKQAPRRRNLGRRTTEKDERDPQITYNEFLRTLLDFQLESHERFLSRFVHLFKQYDTDRNGIVNEHEFRQVLKAIDPSKTEEEVAGLLDLIDPHNNQLISFSECVTFLSTELVRMVREEGH